jgi:hypothetical protein
VHFRNKFVRTKGFVEEQVGGRWHVAGDRWAAWFMAGTLEGLGRMDSACT